jgi:hypothetical protein
VNVFPGQHTSHGAAIDCAWEKFFPQRVRLVRKPAQTQEDGDSADHPKQETSEDEIAAATKQPD